MIVTKKRWEDLEERVDSLETTVANLLVEKFYNTLMASEGTPKKCCRKSKEEVKQEPKKRGRKAKKEEK